MNILSNVAVIGSKCKAEFWTYLGSGDWDWLPVNGEIVEASTKVFAEGAGITYLGAKATFETKNGPRNGQISQSSRNNITDQGNMARIGDKITGERLRNGFISSGGSRKVNAL